MKLGLGSGIGGSGNSIPRYVTDFANGFELPGDTFTGGPTTVADNDGTLVTSPAGVLPIEGMRLTDGVWLPTDASGDPIHTSTPLRTTKGTVSKYAETYKGPLIEPARTNLLTYSEDFSNAAWTKVNATITANFTAAPDGLTTADKIYSVYSAVGYLYEGATVAPGTTYTFSWFVKNIDGNSANYAIYNLTNGSWIKETTAYFSEISTDKWVRKSVVFTAPDGCTNVRLYPVRVESTGTINLAIWGAQLEVGSFATSYIPTGATTVTRPAANLTRPTAGTALKTGNNFAIYGRVVPKAAGQYAYIASLYIDASNWFAVYAADSGTNLRLGKVVAGAVQIVNAPDRYTHAANTPFEYLAYQHSVHGMGIAVKEDGGEWSAWATNANTTNAPIASTYQIGARNNANHFAANYPFTEIISIPASVEPQAWLMDQLAKGRI